MYTLKLSTAITVPFFVFDANGDGVTGIVDGSFTKRISKNGAAFGAMTVTVTEMENGWYSIPVSTLHTDTLGFLALSFSAAGAKRVNLLFQVSARLLDDLAFPTTSGRSIDVAATGEVGLDFDNIHDATGGHTLTNITVPIVTTTTTATTATNLTNAPTNGDFTAVMKTSLNNATPAVTVSDKTGFSLSVAGIQAIWDALTANLTTVNSIGKLLVTNIDALISSRTKPADTQAAVTLVATTTNLTNAPTNGDFTAVMKTSLNNATPSVTVTTNNDKTGYALTAGERTSIADALLDRDMSVGVDSGGRTVRSAFRLLRNKVALALGTMTVYKEDDATPSWTAALTTDATADPIVTVDP